MSRNDHRCLFACWLGVCSLSPALAEDSEAMRAMREYCGSIAEQSDASGAGKSQILNDCIQEQQAMMQRPEVVAAPPAAGVSPQLLEQCYRQADAWFQAQIESGHDNPTGYDSLLDRCVENQEMPKR